MIISEHLPNNSTVTISANGDALSYRVDVDTTMTDAPKNPPNLRRTDTSALFKKGNKGSMSDSIEEIE